MSYDPDNIFAKIINGEAPAIKVYEDSKTLAFLDIFPQSKGHCLVVPKVQAENLFEADNQALAAAITTTRDVAEAIKKALEPDGVMIMQFNGAAAGQSVFHLHFHIVPRWDGVPLRPHGEAGQADKEELEVLADQIRAEI